jgi:hypothetical protein
MVKLKQASPELLNGLPEEDQIAIKKLVSDCVEGSISEINEYGIELEFSDSSGNVRWILVSPKDIE